MGLGASVAFFEGSEAVASFVSGTLLVGFEVLSAPPLAFGAPCSITSTRRLLSGDHS